MRNSGKEGKKRSRKSEVDGLRGYWKACVASVELSDCGSLPQMPGEGHSHSRPGMRPAGFLQTIQRSSEAPGIFWPLHLAFYNLAETDGKRCWVAGRAIEGNSRLKGSILCSPKVPAKSDSVRDGPSMYVVGTLLRALLSVSVQTLYEIIGNGLAPYSALCRPRQALHPSFVTVN